MNYLYLCSYSLLLLFLTDCKKVQYEKIDKERETGAAVTIRNFVRESYDEDGVLQSRVHAEESYIFAKIDRTILYNFEFEQFEDGKFKSHLSCQRGDVNHSIELLTLNGNIKMTSAENRTLYTEELVYNFEEKTLATDTRVHIFSNGTTISGTGLRSDSNLKQVRILNPDAVTRGNPFAEKEK